MHDIVKMRIEIRWALGSTNHIRQRVVRPTGLRPLICLISVKGITR